MVTVIVGKTCSGKDTIVNRLVTKHNFSRIVLYTTRPIRKGETQDITYHYISKDEFIKKIDEGFFAEWKSYVTVEGVWYYGTALEDLENVEDNTVVILPPDRYRIIRKKLKKKPTCIYIYANNSTIKKRLIARGDNEKEAERRLEHDNVDFKDFEYEADKIFYNNEGTDLDKVVERILNYVR